jgi:hypothetical protein
VADGGGLQHGKLGFCWRLDFGNQAIAFAEQEVSDIDGDGFAMLDVHGRCVVTQRVTILDVVVDQGSLVKALNRYGEFSDILIDDGRVVFGCAAERGMHTGREVGSPTVASPGQPVLCDLGSRILRRSHDLCEGIAGEDRLHFCFQLIEVQAVGLILCGQVDNIPDPVQVDGAVDAVILQEGDGDPWDGGGLHVWEAPFQYIETADSNDCVDLTGLDHLCD